MAIIRSRIVERLHRALTIRNNFYAASDNAFEYASGKAFGSKRAVGDTFPEASQVSVIKLRTVVELRLEETIERKGLRATERKRSGE